MSIVFPLEFVVSGAPLSAQSKRSDAKESWKAQIRKASMASLPEGHFATVGPVAATIYHFPAAALQGDIDNIVKLFLDALCRHVFIDDRQVERIVVQKFEADGSPPFKDPTKQLLDAVDSERPVTYVRISDDPLEDFR